LLKKIGGGFGDKARQLAYLLYGICDRKRWAGEGGAYNMLIAAWPEIEKLARQEPTGDSSPETLF
jgi:putative DNA methylase